MLGGRGGKWHLLAPVFLEKFPNMLQNRYKHIFYHFPPVLCKLLLLCCLSVQAAVSLRVETQLLLVFETWEALSQPTFEDPGFRFHWLYKLTEFRPSGSQT